jgi:hypothetical protein
MSKDTESDEDVRYVVEKEGHRVSDVIHTSMKSAKIEYTYWDDIQKNLPGWSELEIKTL